MTGDNTDNTDTGDLTLSADQRSMIEPLTDRQQEILTLMGSGRSTSSIATRLFITPATVRNHIQQIMQRLGAHTRLEAVAINRVFRASNTNADRLIGWCRREDIALTPEQRDAIRRVFTIQPVEPVEPVLPAQTGGMHDMTLTITQQQVERPRETMT